MKDDFTLAPLPEKWKKRKQMKYRIQLIVGYIVGLIGCALSIAPALYCFFVKPEMTNSQIVREYWLFMLIGMLLVWMSIPVIRTSQGKR